MSRRVFRTRSCHLGILLANSVVFAIVYLADTRILAEDLGQRHVDAIGWPEPKSVGPSIFLGVDNLGNRQLFPDVARLPRHLLLCLEAQRMSLGQVRHQSVTTMSAQSWGWWWR